VISNFIRRQREEEIKEEKCVKRVFMNKNKEKCVIKIFFSKNYLKHFNEE
jgi:hypothetical protein